MADAHAPGHDYHLVNPSPWPALAAVGGLVTPVGLVWWMHDGPPWVLIIGLLIIAYTMFVWWRDVIQEAVVEGDHTPVVQLGLRYGMVLFIASEVMFFVAWFWAYFNAFFYPTEQMGSVWPPEGIETFDPWHLPLLNTLILLTSSTTVTWAHHAVREGNQKGAVQGLTVTVLLGVLFTCVQAYEYAVAPFAFTGGIYGSTFFMATGFHGAHVIIGTLFLIVCLFRAAKGHFKPDHHFGLEAAAWYWHFVDVVWIFLFSCIYVWGAGTIAGHQRGTPNRVGMAHYSEASPLAAGLTCRCPRCGTGKLYDGVLRVAQSCDSCGLDLSAQDSGNGPAVFVIFVAGFLAVLLAYIVEMTFAPPAIVHLAYQVPFVTGLSIVLLRIFKAVLIAYQFKHKTPGFDTD